MARVNAQQGRVKAIAVARDVDGNPKLGKEAAVKFWPMLKKEDRVFLNHKFSLNLEIENG